MKYFSIKRRLILLILGSTLLVWLVALLLSFFGARQEINQLVDVQLEQSAQTLALLDLHKLTALAHTTERIHAQKDKDRDNDDLNMEFQVWTDSGRLITHSPSTPKFAYHPQDGYQTIRVHSVYWRTYARHDINHAYQIRLFESIHSRNNLINSGAWHIAQFMLIVLPLSIWLIWLSVEKGLLPLQNISGMLTSRNAQNMEPINPDKIPAEAVELVHSINRLLERLKQSILHERAFTADAAHELRHPLAAIKIQAEVALTCTHPAQLETTIHQIINGVNRLSHLVHQMLLLARLDQSSQIVAEPVNLSQIVTGCSSMLADRALSKNISLEVQAKADIWILGHAPLLSILVDNLIDNAIKYGRKNGHVLLNVLIESNKALMSIEDDGPGVSTQEYQRLTDRFYRSTHHPDVEGSGLGLSIVSKIVKIHHGMLEIHSGHQGQGLKINIFLEAYNPAKD
ncbi:MAG: sensor histidine kinase N-terminal domain-containing protein [Proteobacteria bacterium]|nr:sensor histidine kinase N-terminal domain-containing protein [Pseudomonadota bacterium]MDE3207524.1 sensor histidine kinase N-terminal domain-containing protein [Pseudomonadota bacterium]